MAEIENFEVWWSGDSDWGRDYTWQKTTNTYKKYHIGSGYGENGRYYKSWRSCIEVEIPSNVDTLKITLKSDSKYGAHIPNNERIAGGLSTTPPNKNQTGLPNDIFIIDFLRDSNNNSIKGWKGNSGTGTLTLSLSKDNSSVEPGTYYIYLYSADSNGKEIIKSNWSYWMLWWVGQKSSITIETTNVQIQPPEEDKPVQPEVKPGDDHENQDLKISIFNNNSWHNATPSIYHNGDWHKVLKAWVYTNGNWKQVNK